MPELARTTSLPRRPVATRKSASKPARTQTLPCTRADKRAHVRSRPSRGSGCWFNAARGSGVALNVGKSLRAQDRCAAHTALGIPLSEDHKKNIGDAYCDSESDELYCERARQRGYDSIQLAQTHAHNGPELVMCTDACVKQPLTGACPPVPLRVLGTNTTCSCVEGYSTLNCGGHSKGAWSPATLAPLPKQVVPRGVWTDKQKAMGCEHNVQPEHDPPGSAFAARLRLQATCPTDQATIARLTKLLDRTQPNFINSKSFLRALLDSPKPLSFLDSWELFPSRSGKLMSLWDSACKTGAYPPENCVSFCITPGATHGRGNQLDATRRS